MEREIIHKYPSIPTLKEFVKEPCNPDPSQLLWTAEEKIDGMNVSIQRTNGLIRFYGRERSELAPKHFDGLTKHIDLKKLNAIMPKDKNFSIFGELYGGDIGANGSYYGEGYKFRIFDILIQADDIPSGWIWMSRESVKKIASELKIGTPFELKQMNIYAIKLFLKGTYSINMGILFWDNRYIEGLILRTEPLLLNRKGSRLILKLKKEDVIDNG